MANSHVRVPSARRAAETRKEKFLKRMKTTGINNPKPINGKKPFTINTYYTRGELETL